MSDRSHYQSSYGILAVQRAERERIARHGRHTPRRDAAAKGRQPICKPTKQRRPPSSDSRQRVARTLYERGSATVRELALAAGCSDSMARRRCAELARSGHVLQDKINAQNFIYRWIGGEPPAVQTHDAVGRMLPGEAEVLARRLLRELGSATIQDFRAAYPHVNSRGIQTVLYRLEQCGQTRKLGYRRVGNTQATIWGLVDDA